MGRQRAQQAAQLCVVLISALVGVEAGCSINASAPVLRYAPASQRIYVEGGCATIADIMDFQMNSKWGSGGGPMWHFDSSTSWYASNYTGTYYLEASIFITNGSTLSIDGDDPLVVQEPDTILLASNTSMYVDIVAHGGNLDIRNTKVTSWDLLNKTVDYDMEDGRSSLKALTEKITGRVKDTCPDDPNNGNPGYSNGKAKKDMGNAEMNITNSEIAYLGYDASESYGISYKARGLCKDHSNIDIYDDDNGLNVGVKGNMINNHVHHLYFGHYSWGHDGGMFRGNEVHDNFGYGFDPHDDSDFVSIINNTVYNNGWHGIIASKRCNNLVIAENNVYNSGKNGLMLHRSCDNSTVRDNISFNNRDAGLAMFETSDCKIYGNKFLRNLHGVRFSNGSNRNRVHNNLIRQTRPAPGSKYAFYMYKGNDMPQAEGNPDGYIRNNVLHNNTVFSPEQKYVVYAKEAENNVFENNDFFSGTGTRWANAANNVFRGNSVPETFDTKIDANVCFKQTAGEQLEPLCG